MTAFTSPARAISLVVSMLLLVSIHAVKAKNTALLIIDVQECFMDANGTSTGEPGSLAVADTSEIIPLINQIREEKDGCLFDVVIRSQDFHPEDHISFGPTHGLEPFAHLAGKGELPLTCLTPDSGMMKDASCCPSYHVEPYDCETRLCPSTTSADVTIQRSLDSVLASPACSICRDTPDECFETSQAMWTNHCLQGGDTSFPSELITKESDIIVQKGSNVHVDAYSAFMDNTKKLKTELDDVLKDKDVDTVYILGIATDYCVYYSTIDALALGYETYVVLDATRGIAPDSMDAAVTDMKAKGAKIVNSSDVLAMKCTSTNGDEGTPSGAATNSTDENSGSGSLRVSLARVAVLAVAGFVF